MLGALFFFLLDGGISISFKTGLVYNSLPFFWEGKIKKKKDEGDEWRPTLGFTIQNTFFYIIPPPAKNEFGSIFLFFRVCARGAEMRKTETKNKNDVVRRRYKPRVQQRQREGGEKQSVIAIEWEEGGKRGVTRKYM